MKTKQITKYQCEICKTWYDKSNQALECEAKPVSQNKGVKIGDVIIITQGEGAGQAAQVSDIFVYSIYWGHYRWERYWHTVGLNVDLMGDGGSRSLAFDDYKVL